MLRSGIHGKDETIQREAIHPSDLESASEQRECLGISESAGPPYPRLPPFTLCRTGLTVAQHVFGHPEDGVCISADATHSCHQQSSHTPCLPHAGTASLLRRQQVTGLWLGATTLPSSWVNTTPSQPIKSHTKTLRDQKQGSHPRAHKKGRPRDPDATFRALQITVSLETSLTELFHNMDVSLISPQMKLYKWSFRNRRKILYWDSNQNSKLVEGRLWEISPEISRETYSSVHPTTHPFILLVTHPPIHSPTHQPSVPLSFVHPSIYPSFFPSIHVSS